MGNKDLTIPPRQPFALQFLSDITRYGKDPDWRYPKYLRDEDGGALGMTEDLPRHGHVFPHDEKKAEHAEDQSLNYDLHNYDTAKQHTKTVRDEYKKEKKLGVTAGPY